MKELLINNKKALNLYMVLSVINTKCTGDMTFDQVVDVSRATDAVKDAAIEYINGNKAIVDSMQKQRKEAQKEVNAVRKQLLAEYKKDPTKSDTAEAVTKEKISKIISAANADIEENFQPKLEKFEEEFGDVEIKIEMPYGPYQSMVKVFEKYAHLFYGSNKSEMVELWDIMNANKEEESRILRPN